MARRSMGSKTLVPTEDRPVFVSPVPGFAACFGVDLRSEKGCHSREPTSSRETHPSPIWLFRPHARPNSLEQPCSLYRVSESATTCEPAPGSVSGFGSACGHEIPVTEAVAYPSVAEALTAHGVRVFRQGVVAMKDRDILDLLDSEQGEAESFFELSGGDMRSLPFFAPLLYAFFIRTPGHAPSRFSPADRRGSGAPAPTPHLPGARPLLAAADGRLSRTVAQLSRGPGRPYACPRAGCQSPAGDDRRRSSRCGQGPTTTRDADAHRRFLFGACRSSKNVSLMGRGGRNSPHRGRRGTPSQRRAANRCYQPVPQPSPIGSGWPGRGVSRRASSRPRLASAWPAAAPTSRATGSQASCVPDRLNSSSK